MPQLRKISFLPAFIYVDAAIDHAHKKIMSLGCSASRWARTLIRKSIVLSIGLAVFGKGLWSEDSFRLECEATYSAITQQYYSLKGIWSVISYRSTLLPDLFCLSHKTELWDYSVLVMTTFIEFLLFMVSQLLKGKTGNNLYFSNCTKNRNELILTNN